MIALICWLKREANKTPPESKKKKKTSPTNHQKNWTKTDHKLTSRFRTIALSRPKIVEGYDSSGSSIRRSRAWICTRCMIAYLSTSKIVPSPVQSSIIQFLETTVFFFRAAWRSDTTIAISAVGFTSARGENPSEKDRTREEIARERHSISEKCKP